MACIGGTPGAAPIASSNSQGPLLGAHGLDFAFGASRIRSELGELVKEYEASLDALLVAPASSAAGSHASRFSGAFGRLSAADGRAALRSAQLSLPALVSGDAEVRTASSEAKKALQHMWAKAYTRADLYRHLVAAADSAETDEERQFVRTTLAKFRQAGAHLESEAARAEVSAIDARCTSLAFQIEQAINEDCTGVEFDEEELEGCDPGFISSLPAAEEASTGEQKKRRCCSVKAPVLLPIMRRAHLRETRRRMMWASQRQCMEANGPRLKELIEKRHQAAVLLGFASHAERMLAPKMAGSVVRAQGFCEDMLHRLAPLRDAELCRLRAAASLPSSSAPAEEAPPQAKRLRPTDGGLGERLALWDQAFYTDMLKRKELSLDDEQLKEFFPLEATIDRMLQIYSEFLGLQFVRSSALPVWHEDVVAFEVLRDGTVVGHLFLDQFPRDGKFGHQMIVPLAPSFVDDASGQRCVPACANISNLPRPQGDKPALLRFAEMQTLFHELGHAMHCLCTSTRFSTLSWAWPMVPWPGGVEQDFLELPSMALEKFASEPALLRRVGGHFATGAAVPEETIEKIQDLDKFMVGTSQSRYFAMALFDLIVHSKPPPYEHSGRQGLSIEELYRSCLESHTLLEQLPDTHPCASWYHLVIGYDAGFYGYGWSDVYAADVFEAMLRAPAGPLAPETGAKLRDEILAPCASRSGSAMLRSFLGRDPTPDAWCRRNGVPS